MRIDEVRTSIRIGEFTLRNADGPNLITFSFGRAVSRGVRCSSSPRVYLFAVDGLIKKIGVSADKRGIQGTLAQYIHSQTGSPGIARFVVHHLIAHELGLNKRVAVHMISATPVIAPVAGLFDVGSTMVAAVKEMEDKCMADYREREQRYPDWNFKENNEPYPPELALLHADYQRRRLVGGGD